MTANDSVAGSAAQLVHAVAGPASLQLHARGADGLDERLLARVERLPGVTGAGPLLEQTATIVGPRGHEATVDLAGTNIGLAQLNGLAQTLPTAAFSSGGIGLSATTARELGVTTSGVGRAEVTLRLRGEVARAAGSGRPGTRSRGRALPGCAWR